MQMLGDQLNAAPSLNQLTIPDLWQQQAVTALREGCDVVVQAPTGSRHVRKKVRAILNSRGEWERAPKSAEAAPSESWRAFTRTRSASTRG